MKDKKLYRSCRNRMLGGVAGGLGEYFEVDPTIIRILFLISLFAGGLGIIVYLFSWVIIPNDPKCGSSKRASEEIKEAADSLASQAKEETKNIKNRDLSTLIGVVIVVIGGIFLVKTLTGINVWSNFWPIAIIALGFAILVKDFEKEKK